VGSSPGPVPCSASRACIRRQRDRWHRTSSSHPQTPVRAESATTQRPSCACNMECRPCCISPKWLSRSLPSNSLSCFTRAHLRRIDDVAACEMRDVFAPGTVAAFATDIPFRDLLCVNVEVDGVAAIACGARGPLHIVGRIEGCPPVCSAIRNVVRAPSLITDVPLSGERIIVVAYFGEVPLFPDAAVHQSNLVLREF
jgi:hypothetical protein